MIEFRLDAGQHSFKFGGIYNSRNPGRFNIENPRLRYESKADLLANIPSRAQFFFGVKNFTSHSFEAGFFAQDDWRVIPKLVINLGVRYDFFSKLIAKLTTRCEDVWLPKYAQVRVVSPEKRHSADGSRW